MMSKKKLALVVLVLTVVVGLAVWPLTSGGHALATAVGVLVAMIAIGALAARRQRLNGDG